MKFEQGDVVFITIKVSFLVSPLGIIRYATNAYVVVAVDTISGRNEFRFARGDIKPVNKFFKRLYGIN